MTSNKGSDSKEGPQIEISPCLFMALSSSYIRSYLPRRSTICYRNLTSPHLLYNCVPVDLFLRWAGRIIIKLATKISPLFNLLFRFFGIYSLLLPCLSQTARWNLVTEWPMLSSAHASLLAHWAPRRTSSPQSERTRAGSARSLRADTSGIAGAPVIMLATFTNQRNLYHLHFWTSTTPDPIAVKISKVSSMRRTGGLWILRNRLLLHVPLRQLPRQLLRQPWS